MENKFSKYFKRKEGENWHTYKIGEYHITAIGCSHQDIEPEIHYGPCLRVTWQNYKNAQIERQDDYWEEHIETMGDSGEGNITMGKILHKEAEEVRKHNDPSVNIEFAIILEHEFPEEHFTKEEVEKGLNKVKILTSLDIIEQVPEKFVNDLKTAGNFTFPTSEFDYNITYEDQVDLCTYMATEFVFRKSYFNPKKKLITYIKKEGPSLKVCEIPISYDKEKAKMKYEDFLERILFLHLHIIRDTMPPIEPQKWCKYCPLLKEICMPNGDIKEVKEGKKTRYLKNA